MMTTVMITYNSTVAMVAMAREDDNGHEIANNAIIGIVVIVIDYDGNIVEC